MTPPHLSAVGANAPPLFLEKFFPVSKRSIVCPNLHCLACFTSPKPHHFTHTLLPPHLLGWAGCSSCECKQDAGLGRSLWFYPLCDEPGPCGPFSSGLKYEAGFDLFLWCCNQNRSAAERRHGSAAEKTDLLSRALCGGQKVIPAVGLEGFVQRDLICLELSSPPQGSRR